MLNMSITELLSKKVSAFTLAEVFSPHFAGSRKYAFTLAEVLITLGIIGVVAAMTLPTLIGYNQKKTAITQLKKAYSEFAQTINMAQVEQGTMDSWDFSQFSTSGMAADDPNVAQLQADRLTYFSEKYVFPYVKVLKKCVPSSSECWADTIHAVDGSQVPETVNDSSKVSYITPAGYSVFYWLYSGGTGGHFLIDVNGPKKPNRLGKDVFWFVMTWGNKSAKSGVFPYGFSTANALDREEIIRAGTHGCRIDAGARVGAYCAALLMTDNWEMKDDYPW